MWAAELLVTAVTVLAFASGMSVTDPGSNCQMSYEEIHSQKCKPQTTEACLTVDFPTEDVEYKKVCKDVTSVHCPTTRSNAHLLNKREAKAQWPLHLGGWPFASTASLASAYQPLYQTYPTQASALVYPTYQPVATSVSAAAAASSVIPTAAAPTPSAAEQQCHQVTTEHCLSQPVKVSKTLPVQKCHPVTKIHCEPHVQKVPKTVCKPLSTSVSDSRKLYNPFAYVDYVKNPLY